MFDMQYLRTLTVTPMTQMVMSLGRLKERKGFDLRFAFFYFFFLRGKKCCVYMCMLKKVCQ